MTVSCQIEIRITNINKTVTLALAYLGFWAKIRHILNGIQTHSYLEQNFKIYQIYHCKK